MNVLFLPSFFWVNFQKRTDFKNSRNYNNNNFALIGILKYFYERPTIPLNFIVYAICSELNTRRYCRNTDREMLSCRNGMCIDIKVQKYLILGRKIRFHPVSNVATAASSSSTRRKGPGFSPSPFNFPHQLF